MPKYDLAKKIANGELSRRQMIKALGAAGVMTTLSPVISKSAFFAPDFIAIAIP